MAAPFASDARCHHRCFYRQVSVARSKRDDRRHREYLLRPALFEDMAFALHLLRSDDCFLDVGANIGSYTILAGCGSGSRVIAVEPIASTFEALRANVAANRLENRVRLFCCGAGVQEDDVYFSTNCDTTNHVLGKQAGTNQPAASVTLRPLDSLCDGQVPLLLKLDVEGFERPALEGARTLLESRELKALIVELNGSGARYGYSDDSLHKFISGFGYSSFAYDPFTREMMLLSSSAVSGNTLYVKDQGFATAAHG